MRVKNYTDETLKPTDEFVIKDTEENEYGPVELAANVFAYRPDPAAAPQVLPTPDTAAPAARSRAR